MSVYKYLVRPDNKTIYELGKTTGWNDTLGIFKVKTNMKLIPNNKYAEEEFIETFNVCDTEMLEIVFKEHIKENNYEKGTLEDTEFVKYVINSIINFCDGNIVCMLYEGSDTLVELKRDYGFSIVESIYNYKKP
jgi:hypothetical protein